MKAMIEAGAAGVHFEDQLASVKKCGHMGGKVLVPTRENIAKLTAARLAADVSGAPTVLLARTDAEAADLITSDCGRQRQAVPDGRTHGGRFLSHEAGSGTGDLAWPRLRAVRRHDLVRNRQAGPRVREEIRRRDPQGIPGPAAVVQLLAVVQLEEEPGRRTIAKFQRELGAMGYKFQFITLAGFHALNYSMFNLAHGYARNQMTAFVEMQQAEFARPKRASPRSSTSAKSAPATSTP
jgi:Isocitrate lyase